jgi:hypothetical protein
MEEFFHPDTLTNPLVNVNGRGAKGNNNENLIALNPVKVDQIRRTVLGFVEGDSQSQRKYMEIMC